MDHDLGRGHAVRRHQPGALGLGPFQPFDARDVDARPGAELVEDLRPRDRATSATYEGPRTVAPSAKASLRAVLEQFNNVPLLDLRLVQVREQNRGEL